METQRPASPALRRLSARALAWLQHFEQGPNGSFAAVPYVDDAGHRTVGWGHKIRPHERFDTPLTRAQADALLREDLRTREIYVGALAIALDQGQFDALVMFAFNFDVGRLDRSTLLKRIRVKSSLEDIARQWFRWVNMGEPPQPTDGLKRRRVVEWMLYAGRSDAAIAQVNARLMVIAQHGTIAAADMAWAMGVA